MEKMIVTNVRSLLPRHNPGLGLLFTFEIVFTFHDPTDITDPTEKRSVEILVERPDNFTRVFSRVFSGVEDRGPALRRSALKADVLEKWEEEASKKWMLDCDHDSEWTSFKVLKELDSYSRRRAEDMPKGEY
tara:strand:+ start:27536 stop:27931 length:396 start_codon:yes stop_codon:yes gene_type:complete